jgi:hypothetical protein
MIKIRQRPVPRSRTQTGSLWEATAEIDGKSYFGVSRHGAPQALARALVAAGIPDQPAEVCISDNGAEIRTEQLQGCISYRSLHAMVEATFEEGDRPLHRARFKERPQIAFPLQPCEQEMRFIPSAGILPLPSSRKPSPLMAEPGKNAFHRLQSMFWSPRRVKRRPWHLPQRRAAATAAAAISCQLARGHASAALPAGCGLIAGSPEEIGRSRRQRCLTHHRTRFPWMTRQEAADARCHRAMTRTCRLLSSVQEGSLDRKLWPSNASLLTAGPTLAVTFLTMCSPTRISRIRKRRLCRVLPFARTYELAPIKSPSERVPLRRSVKTTSAGS